MVVCWPGIVAHRLGIARRRARRSLILQEAKYVAFRLYKIKCRANFLSGPVDELVVYTCQLGVS